MPKEPPHPVQGRKADTVSGLVTSADDSGGVVVAEAPDDGCIGGGGNSATPARIPRAFPKIIPLGAPEGSTEVVLPMTTGEVSPVAPSVLDSPSISINQSS